MNANQIINMVIRMVMGRVLRSGVDLGINAVSNRMNRNKPDGQQTQAGKPGGPNAAETQKRMRQTMRVTRRIGRF